MSRQKNPSVYSFVNGGRDVRRCRTISWWLGFLCCFSIAGSAQQFCTSKSSIDEVPFFVGQTFHDILNRAPARGGQLAYIQQVESLNTANCHSANAALSAETCEWQNNATIALWILDSAESIGKHGSLASNSAFVTALYTLLLRRAPDAAGLQYYVSRLNAGAARANIVWSFLASVEYRKRFICTYGAVNPSCNGAEAVDSVPSFVTQTYQDILGRSPDDPGQVFWTGYISSNQVAMCANTSATSHSVCDRVLEASTTLSFFDGQEYQASHPSIAQNGNFVTALYDHLLRRPPEGSGLQFYTDYLNNTNDRAGVIYAFINSDEYRRRFACYAGARDQLNFGINGHPFTSVEYSNTEGVSYSMQMDLVQDLGLTWYRANISVPSSGADYSNMDALLSTAQTAGIQLLPVIFPTVNLVKDTPAQAYSESYSSAFSIVNRYKAFIHVWELWNEGDVYSNRGPAYQGVSLKDYDPTRLAISKAILHGLADGARAADPGCIRVINFGWTHTGFIQALENDAVPYEVVGIHWYANSATTGDPAMGDITCPGQSLPCPAHPVNPNLIEQLHAFTNGKPLWLTENNYWPQIASNSVSTNITWEEDYLFPTLQMYMNSPSAYPYQVVMIYELLDEPDLHGGASHTQMGLYEVVPSNGGFVLGAAKPVYQEIQQLLAPK